MRTISEALKAAQREMGDVYCIVTFTKTGQTTRSYDNYSTATELLSVSNKEYVGSHTAEVIVDNYDGVLSSLDLRGYKAVISNGYIISAVATSSPKPPLYVIAQREDTWESRAVVIFSLASKANQLGSDRARIEYKGLANNTDTVQTLISAIMAGTISIVGTTDLLGAIKTQAVIGASSIVLKSLGTGTINENTLLTIQNDTTIYKVTADATIASNEATLSISPVLVAQADVDEVVTLISPYGHCEVFTIGGTIDTDKDPVINSFKPADFLNIRYGESRRAILDVLFRYTFTVYRMEDDGDFGWYHYKNGHAKAWSASTVIREGETRKPITANGHVYTCTTAGITHGTIEPTWPTTEDATVTDNTVVWKLDYDYQYALEDGSHPFWRKGKMLTLVVPNEIVIESDPSHTTTYYGTATDSESNALLDMPEQIRLRLTGVDEANNIAKGVLEHHQIDANAGYVLAPMNVGIELYDLVRIYDSGDSVSIVGNVLAMHDSYRAGVFNQSLQLGRVSATLGIRPSTLSIPDRSDTAPATFGDLNNLLDIMNEQNQSILGLIDAILNVDLATITQVDTGTDEIRVITPATIAGSIFGRRIVVFTLNALVALTTDDKAYARIPAAMNGFNLVAVAASCKTPGSTSGAVTLTVKNGATSMLSTNITIDQDETDTLTAAIPAVIDTAEDDVATGDQIEVAVSGAGTGVLYCQVELMFALP